MKYLLRAILLITIMYSLWTISFPSATALLWIIGGSCFVYFVYGVIPEFGENLGNGLHDAWTKDIEKEK